MAEVPHAKKSLIEDIRAIPSWVWLGMALAVGLLVILSGKLGGSQSSSSTLPASTTLAPQSASTPLDTYTQNAQVSSIDYALSQIQSELTALQQTGLTQQGANPSTGTITGGQPPAIPVPSTQSNWSIINMTGGPAGNGLFAMQQGSNGQFAQQLQYSNGAWVPVTQQQIAGYYGPHGTATGTNYLGPGNYFGQMLPALP